MTSQDDVLQVVEAYAAEQFAAGQSEATGDLQPRIDQLTVQNARLTDQVKDLTHQLDVALHPVEVLLKMDLSLVPLGQVTAVGAGKVFGFGGKIGADSTWRDFTVVADPDGRRFLRWTSRRNTEGSANGISLAIPLARRVDEATFEMGVRFSKGFGWGLGGKLPGLSMTTPGTSGTLAGGGVNPGKKASSNRHMWIVPATGTFPQPDGTKRRAMAPAEPTSYVYLDGVTEQERLWGVPFVDGQLMMMRSRDVLNSFAGAVPNTDGRLQAWADGKPTRDDAIKWRTDPTNQISHLFWSLFRGGPNNDPKWADNDAVVDWIDIADGLVVTTPRA